MLKAQLKSKMFQVTWSWRDIEDILTGDFFGTLDYLPRSPYLRDFVSYIGSLNPDVQTPPVEGVDWDNLELMFWPLLYTDDENAEPDIVLISNKWVLVIEVKLNSGLGNDQPWREYIVGRQIAEDNAIPQNSVYYLVAARNRTDIATTFKSSETDKLHELAARTSYLKWHEVVALIESWMKSGIDGWDLLPEHVRMLNDLFAVMKKRRAIAFSGYSFANVQDVATMTDGIFCPPVFIGFLSGAPQTEHEADTVFLQHGHRGFIAGSPEVESPDDYVFFGKNFGGFTKGAPRVSQASDCVFWSSTFEGFLDTSPACSRVSNLFLEG